MEMFIQGAKRSDGNLNGNDENGKKFTFHQMHTNEEEGNSR